MKKIGNRPITEADTDFSKLQKKLKKKIKKKNLEKISENFRDFFFLFLILSYLFVKKVEHV